MGKLFRLGPDFAIVIRIGNPWRTEMPTFSSHNGFLAIDSEIPGQKKPNGTSFKIHNWTRVSTGIVPFNPDNFNTAPCFAAVYRATEIMRLLIFAGAKIICYRSAMFVPASRYQRAFNWLNAKRLMGVLMMLPKDITPEVSVEVAPDCMDVIGVILDVIVLD